MKTLSPTLRRARSPRSARFYKAKSTELEILHQAALRNARSREEIDQL